MEFEGLMVSVSGVRGRVADGLTPVIACQFAAAFGAFSLSRSSSRAIVLGRDSRVSGANVVQNPKSPAKSSND